MGPRRRRRLITATICLVVVAAVATGLALWVAHTSGPSRTVRRTALPSLGVQVSRNSQGSFSVYGGGVASKLTFGMTPHEVQRRIGRPTKTLRDKNGSTCWQYDENLKAVMVGIATVVPGHTLDATMVCFVGGHYALDHEKVDGRWDY